MCTKMLILSVNDDTQQQWGCAVCTKHNGYDRKDCEICEYKRPQMPVRKTADRMVMCQVSLSIS
jgi:hypothetical protein